MGNNAILAEALNENQQNILVSLMKVQISSKTSKIIACFQEAEHYFMDPVLSYWVSGLMRADNDDPTWTWAYCKLRKGFLILNLTTLAGQKVPPSWSNWNEMAVPNITGHNQDCMQYLSGTAFGKGNTKSSEKI